MQQVDIEQQFDESEQSMDDPDPETVQRRACADSRSTRPVSKHRPSYFDATFLDPACTLVSDSASDSEGWRAHPWEVHPDNHRYNIYKPSGVCQSFQAFLSNVFDPLFAVPLGCLF